MRGQPRRLSRWTNLANGPHEECSFVSGRDADKNPASTRYSENEIEHESDFIGCGHRRVAGLSDVPRARERNVVTPKRARTRSSRKPHAAALPRLVHETHPRRCLLALRYCYIHA